MFAVIEDEQERLRPQHIGEGAQERPARLLAQPEDARHCAGHQARIGQRCQLHEPDPVRIGVQQVSSDLER